MTYDNPAWSIVGLFNGYFVGIEWRPGKPPPTWQSHGDVARTACAALAGDTDGEVAGVTPLGVSVASRDGPLLVVLIPPDDAWLAGPDPYTPIH